MSYFLVDKEDFLNSGGHADNRVIKGNTTERNEYIFFQDVRLQAAFRKSRSTDIRKFWHRSRFLEKHDVLSSLQTGTYIKTRYPKDGNKPGSGK